MNQKPHNNNKVDDWNMNERVTIECTLYMYLLSRPNHLREIKHLNEVVLRYSTIYYI